MNAAQQNCMNANIDVMNSLESFNVIIICCGSSDGAKFWQTRLTQGKGSVVADSSIVIAVHEDWPGGAGNALGSLYAYQNAVRIANDDFDLDIDKQLRSGKISVGLYHTAGKGTRLAPLPGAENNNKPGVKLPAAVRVNGEEVSITILESCVKQTGCYGKSRLGRLSVFWGDQIFIPTVSVEYTPKYHADILCSLGPMMDEAEWSAKGMDKYGLIALTKSGKAAQVEKVTHAQAVDLLGHLDSIESVGASLGSFSVSSALLFALLDEFLPELMEKKGKLDSDPHWWMPMTLQRASYITIMSGKGVDAEAAGKHFDRIDVMMGAFLTEQASSASTSTSTSTPLGTFGPVNVGAGLCWWDYGQMKLYARNALLIAEDNDEARLMRKFFRMAENERVSNSQVGETDIDGGSVVAMSNIRSGSVKNCVLSGVRCRSIDAVGCILVNVTADRIVACPGSIIYNVVSTGTIEAGDGIIHAGVTAKDGTQTVIHSAMSIDGGQAWDLKVEGNEHTFGEVHGKLNAGANPLELEAINKEAHAAVWAVVETME